MLRSEEMLVSRTRLVVGARPIPERVLSVSCHKTAFCRKFLARADQSRAEQQASASATLCRAPGPHSLHAYARRTFYGTSLYGCAVACSLGTSSRRPYKGCLVLAMACAPVFLGAQLHSNKAGIFGTRDARPAGCGLPAEGRALQRRRCIDTRETRVRPEKTSTSATQAETRQGKPPTPRQTHSLTPRDTSGRGGGMASDPQWRSVQHVPSCAVHGSSDFSSFILFSVKRAPERTCAASRELI